MVKEEDIKKVVNQFKKENGNASISLDDMMIYIVERVDNLPCEEHIKTISKNDGRIDVLIVIITTLFAATFTILTGLIFKMMA